MLADCW